LHMTDSTKTILMILTGVLSLSACAKRKETAEAILVRTASAVADGAGSRYYSGTIEAGKDISLSFLTSGTVAEVSVREGEAVNAGQPLAKLDCRSNSDALQIAEAKAKQAQDAFSRFEPMYKNGNLPEIKMVDIETSKTETELAVKLAAKNAADCTLSAPESGIISARDVEPGITAIPGKPVLRLVAIDKVFASIAVPEQEIKAIRPGMRADVEIPALAQQPERDGSSGIELAVHNPQAPGKFKGIVLDSGVTANPLARTYTVRVALDNPNRRILPDMICNVYLLAAGKSNSVIVPGTALRIDESGRKFVYVVDTENHVHEQPVTAADFGSYGDVVISQGLRGNEKVVTSGVHKLSEGAFVRVEP